MIGKDVKINEYTLRFLAGAPNCELFKVSLERAYSDMARRTMCFTGDYKRKTSIDKTKISQNIKNTIIDNVSTILKNGSDKIISIYELIENLPKEDEKQQFYDNWHEKMCCKIVSEFITKENIDDYFYGQAQKLLNMTIKYIVLINEYYKVMGNKHYDNKIEGITKITNYFHSPVDSQVIENARGLGVKKPRNAWSRMKKDEYKKFQKNLREKLTDKSPFEWEYENFPFY